MLTNAETVDLVTRDNGGAWCELVLVVDAGEWELPNAKELLVEKLNSYLVYVVEGQLQKSYPTTEGLEVRITVQSIDPIPAWASDLLARITPIAAKNGVRVQVLPL